MHRGTTPAQIFETDTDLTNAKVYITYSQNGRNILEKTSDSNDVDIEKNIICVRLTQEDTLKFKIGTVLVQLRYIMENGASDASDLIEINIDKILKEGVIAYGS